MATWTVTPALCPGAHLGSTQASEVNASGAGQREIVSAVSIRWAGLVVRIAPRDFGFFAIAISCDRTYDAGRQVFLVTNPGVPPCSSPFRKCWFGEQRAAC